MRDVFREFYRPGPEDERRFVVEGTVVVDANVLLGLYEFSVEQRNEALNVLAKMGERLWIPYQVGLEYQRNRLSIINRQAGNYRKLVNLHGSRTEEKLIETLEDARVPPEVANEIRPLLSGLAGSLHQAVRDYIGTVESILERHIVTSEQGLKDDPVRNRLDLLYTNRVGAQPGRETRTARVAEATQRRNNQIPPGYKDDDKKNDEAKAGDYLLWAELLDHAEATKDDGRPFLFVTNDTKEDWYERSGGEIIGPRVELDREFRERNPHGYHQVTLGTLLELGREHLDAEVGDATIEKASELSKSRSDFSWPTNDAAWRALANASLHADGDRDLRFDNLLPRVDTSKWFKALWQSAENHPPRLSKEALEAVNSQMIDAQLLSAVNRALEANLRRQQVERSDAASDEDLERPTAEDGVESADDD